MKRIARSCAFTMAFGGVAACASSSGGGNRGLAEGLSGDIGTITHAASGLCVGTPNGSAVDLEACDARAGQTWTYAQGTLVGLGGKCLEVQNGATANGTAVDLAACTGSAQQQWAIANGEIVGAGGVRLDVPGGLANASQMLWVWQQNSGPNQQFRFNVVSCGTDAGALSSGDAGCAPKPGPLAHALSGLCAAVTGGSATNGASVSLAACDASAAQAWTLEMGQLKVLGKCLEVQNGATANGTPVDIRDCDGSAQQEWTLSNGQLIGLGGARLDVPGGQANVGQTLWVWQQNNGPNQQFSYGGTTCAPDAGGAPPPSPPPPATGGGSDPTGTQAQRIADMMEIFGANIFSNGQDGQPGETVAGIASAAQYILGQSGLTMLFRGYVNAASDYDTFGPQLHAATGCAFSLCMGIGDQPNPAPVIGLAQASVNQGRWVRFVEAGNEPNTNFGAPYQTGVSPAAEAAAQQQIYAAVHPLGIPVAAASVVGDYQQIASYWGGSLASAVASSDLYNTHLYPNNGGPNGANQLHDWTAAVSSHDWQNKGGLVTEWQPVLYQNGHPTDDVTAAYWTPIALLSGYVDFHLQGLMWWEMFDYPGYNPHVGLFNGTAGNPYPAAKVMRAMYGLTGDTGATKHSFTPGKLDLTVTGLPAGPNAYAGGRYAVFQSSTGTYFVFVWNEQNALDTGATSAVDVTFNAGPMAKVVDYSLTNPISDAPAPKQTLTNVTSVHLDLTTEVRLLQVTHP